MDGEKTIKLVKELADTLESVAVGPLHTPRLYSTFLKAVIASKTGAAASMNGEREGFENGESSDPPTSPSINASPATSIQSPHLQQQHQAGTQLDMITPNPSSTELAPSMSTASANDVFPGYESYFQNDGEMGPVVDISTFPPTMADHDQTWPSLSVDNIFPNAFWDNVLVPGMSNSTAVL